MIISAPWIKPERISEFVSLVDLLPTFNGLAVGGGWSDSVEPLAGIDLTTLLDSGNPIPSRSIYAEYLAESTTAPIFMIRRGKYKYISSSADPKLLFDLEADPNESDNIASRPEYLEIANKFEAEVKSKWNEDEITERILLSQTRRRLILDSQRDGTSIRWNHDEKPDEKVLWYRGEGSYNEWAFDYLPPTGSQS